MKIGYTNDTIDTAIKIIFFIILMQTFFYNL